MMLGSVLNHLNGKNLVLNTIFIDSFAYRGLYIKRKNFNDEMVVEDLKNEENVSLEQPIRVYGLLYDKRSIIFNE